jgi:hypothetical protein
VRDGGADLQTAVALDQSIEIRDALEVDHVGGAHETGLHQEQELGAARVERGVGPGREQRGGSATVAAGAARRSGARLSPRWRHAGAR